MKVIKKIVLFNVLILALLIMFLNNQNVFAESNYQYNILFDYTCTYIVNTSSTVISNEENIKETIIYNSYGMEVPLSIFIKTNKALDSNIINNGGYINSHEIEIYVQTEYEDYKLYLFDSYNNEISSTGDDYMILDYLIDDTYYFKAILSGAGNLIDNRTYEKYQTECSFSFTIDTTPPIIKGASLYMDGIYCNDTFKISGFDQGSGIKEIYMLEPNGQKYQNIGKEIEISCSKCGVVTFYAIDNVGNRSNLYYIYNDIKSPTGVIKDTAGNIINDSYTMDSFYYEAKDNDSKVSYMEYKKPHSSYFEVYDGQIISNTNNDGIYQFRSYDNAGNVSEIVEINLFKINSVVEIIHLENSNKVYLTWENDEYEVIINDAKYYKNSIINEEGIYNVKIINQIGNISYLSFTISCYYKLTKIEQPTCCAQGYTLYNCISCNSEQKANYTKKIPHAYQTKNVDSTCETEGGTIARCIYCDEYYYINKTPKQKHKYETYFVIVPTCTEEGIREFKCSVCGYKEQKNITMLGHKYYILQEEKDGFSSTIYYMCDECGIIEVYTYKVFENDVLNTIKTIIDNYFQYIITILLVTSSIWSLFIGIKVIISSSKEETLLTKKMIKNYIIGLIIIFILIVIIPYLIDAIIKII